MSSQSSRIAMLTVLAVFALAFTQTTAPAQERGPSILKIGTVITMQGFEKLGDNWVPFDQYMKCSGRLILPETQANMYYFLEYWGRDSGTMIMRLTSAGEMLSYSQGREYRMFMYGPVGTSWEATVEGHAMRGEIVGDGITLTLPTGEVYSNLVKMNLYCMDCAAEPVLLESHWLSREIGFEVLIYQENPPFWEWLVGITRK